MLHWHPIALHSESVASPGKYVTLSEQRDRFGDPFAHVFYQSAQFDEATRRFARDLADRFAAASGADDRRFPDAYDSGAHHMGGCRMGRSGWDSVVDPFGRVHGVPNLFVVGSSTFVGPSGAVNPALTLVALRFVTREL